MLEPSDCDEFTIENLPDEVLEYILSLISPYQDIHECMQVSKRWRKCILNVIKIRKRNLHRAISESDIKWETIPVQLNPPGITKRYSHSAVINGDSMYVFGGCTCSMTTFNDLWRLDLSTRTWVRPITMGNYPSPKACSSLVSYKNKLILFGGWTYPPSYPLYQSWHLFNELHAFDISANKWIYINTDNCPPRMAGHSVSIIGEWMVLFGGLYKFDNAVHCEKSNDVWRLNLNSWVWEKMTVAGDQKPPGRVGQTQVILDDENILIMGGSGGPNLFYSDIWVLNMSTDIWAWKEIKIRDDCYKPLNIWSNPGCKYGDKIVVLNKIRETETPPIVYYPKNTWLSNRNDHYEDGKSARIDLANRKPDTDENINGKRGTLRHPRKQEDSPSGSSSSSPGHSDVINRLSQPPAHLSLTAFQTLSENAPRSKTDILRDRRLAMLEKNSKPKKKFIHHDMKKKYLGLHVLDISHILDPEPYVTWLPPKECDNGPEETVLYSFVKGKSELIMFGGIQQDVGSSMITTSDISNQISNSVYFITAPNYVI